MTVTQQFVHYECTGGVATIRLDRPAKLNAFNDEMVRQLADALREFDVDDEARVAVLHGAGRAFSSGADVGERQRRPHAELVAHGPQAWDADAANLLVRAVNWKPVIAAPHGFVLGLALGIVLECDLVVAASGTLFQVTETQRGLGAARYWALLSAAGGDTFATDVTLTSRFFDADEALRVGMIGRVVAEDARLATAHKLAGEIASQPPLSVRATVRARRWRLQQLSQHALLFTDPLRLHLSADFAESARAFTEKRPPMAFEGR